MCEMRKADLKDITKDWMRNCNPDLLWRWFIKYSGPFECLNISTEIGVIVFHVRTPYGVSSTIKYDDQNR